MIKSSGFAIKMKDIFAEKEEPVAGELLNDLDVCY
jgi:hypothetical protein